MTPKLTPCNDNWFGACMRLRTYDTTPQTRQLVRSGKYSVKDLHRYARNTEYLGGRTKPWHDVCPSCASGVRHWSHNKHHWEVSTSCTKIFLTSGMIYQMEYRGGSNVSQQGRWKLRVVLQTVLPYRCLGISSTPDALVIYLGNPFPDQQHGTSVHRP